MIQQRSGVNCLSLPWDDEPQQLLQPWLARAVLFALAARPAAHPAEQAASKHLVLVHCTAGVSRSASVVVAVLLVSSLLQWAAVDTGAGTQSRALSKAPATLEAPHSECPASSAVGCRGRRICMAALRWSGVASTTASDDASPVQCCLAFVRRSRPFVRPNWGFMQQLEAFSSQLGRVAALAGGTEHLNRWLTSQAAEAASDEVRDSKL